MSNTITAYFKGRVGVAESVYQNDYGMIMVFDGIELPAYFDCYFSRLNQDESFPGVGAYNGYDNRVAIPNEVLAAPGTVTVHIPLHTGANDSEVEYIVYFKVVGRARPMDDGTPAQMTAIEQAIALLNHNNIKEHVYAWLNEHPEATTTVQDHSLTYNKFVNGTLYFVTPEMFGAVGDGETDDSDAIEEASEHGIVVGKEDSVYYIGQTITIQNDVINLNAIISNEASLVFAKDNLLVANCDFQNDTYAPSSTRGQWMVVARNSKNVNIANCYFHKGVSAIYVDRCSEIHIHDNTFEDLRQYNVNGYGVLFIECKQAIVSNNIFKNVARHSVYVSVDDTSSHNEDILIVGNTFAWDENVYGNTTGFEITVNIRPAKRITIANNKFINMFGIASFVTQEMPIDGVSTMDSPEHVIIQGNEGTFANNPRTTNGGVIFAPGVSNDTQTKDLIIKDNIINLDQGIVVCIDNQFDNIVIENNIINYGRAYWSQVFCMPDPNESGVSGRLTISKNYIRSANDIFCVRTKPHTFGDVVIADNDVDVVELGNFKDGTSFASMKIVGNLIKSTNARTYWASATVGELTLKNNTSNQIISLWLAATAVKSTDPVFKEYGFDRANPSGCAPGSIHTQFDGSVHIVNANGTWVQISNA